jgi:hypothetical protein
MDYVRRFVQRVLNHWDRQGISYLPGVAVAEIHRMERQLGVELPHDFRAFYLLTNGTDVPGSEGTDRDFFKFWRLQKCDRTGWLLTFIDFMHNAAYYAVDVGGGAGYGRGSVYFIHEDRHLVAKTFDEFTKLYVEGDPRLEPPGAAAYHRRVLAREE